MTDWPALLPDVARRLLGEPPRIEADGATWRYRAHGSLAVHVGGAQRGTFRDFEADVSGGTLRLVEHLADCDRAGALRYLADARLIAPSGAPDAPAAAATVESGTAAPRSLPESSVRRSVSDPRGPGGAWTRPESAAPAGAGPGPQGGDSGRPAPTAEVAAAILAAAVPADDTPARVYLARRFTWPPLGTGPSLPPVVRWLPAAAVVDLPAWSTRDGAPRRLVLPADAAGCVVYRLAPPGARLAAADAVSIDAVTVDGELTAPRLRRTYGAKTGHVFEARRRPGGAVVLVEGEADALALAVTGAGGVVRAVLGTAGYRPAAAIDHERRPVVLVPDANHAGAAAVTKLLAADLDGRAMRLAPWPAPATGDVAAWLAAELSERAGIREYDGALPRPDADRAAWRDLLAAVDRGWRLIDLEVDHA